VYPKLAHHTFYHICRRCCSTYFYSFSSIYFWCFQCDCFPPLSHRKVKVRTQTNIYNCPMYVILPEDYKMKYSSVRIVTRPMAGRLRIIFRFPTQAVCLSLLQTVQAEFAVQVANYAMWLVKRYPREWNGWNVNPATHFNLVPKSRMRRLIPPRHHMPNAQRTCMNAY
jgi:hypothetical protein